MSWQALLISANSINTHMVHACSQVIIAHMSFVREAWQGADHDVQTQGLTGHYTSSLTGMLTAWLFFFLTEPTESPQSLRAKMRCMEAPWPPQVLGNESTASTRAPPNSTGACTHHGGYNYLGSQQARVASQHGVGRAPDAGQHGI